MEKNILKRMYMCVKLSHSAVQQRLAKHCKSTILQTNKQTTQKTPKSKQKNNVFTWKKITLKSRQHHHLTYIFNIILVFMFINYLSKLEYILCCFDCLHTINNHNYISNTKKILVFRTF